MNRMEIIKDRKDYCIKHTVSMQKTFNLETGEAINGKLFASHESVYAALDNGINVYIIHFDIEDIHGNVKNALAKEFCNEYSLEQLQAEYIKEMSRKAELAQLENIKREADAEFFKTHLTEISTGFSYGEWTVNSWTCGVVVKYCYHSERDKDYNYNGRSFVIEISKPDADTFRVNAVYYKHIDEEDKIFTCSYPELIEYMKRISGKINTAIDTMMQDRAEINRQREYEFNFKLKCYNMLQDKAHTYIFKTAKGSFNVNKGVRWSNKGEGKFYKINAEQLYKMLTEKKINTYAVVDSDADERIRDIIDTLEFMPIVTV